MRTNTNRQTPHAHAHSHSERTDLVADALYSAAWSETINGIDFAFHAGDTLLFSADGIPIETRSFVHVRTPWPRMPHTLLLPASASGAVADFAGAHDIDLEDTRFSRRTRLRSVKKRFAYDVFDPRMIQRIDALKRIPHIEIEGTSVLILNTPRVPILLGTGLWSPDEFDEHADVARDFIQHLPAHVVDILSRRAP